MGFVRQFFSSASAIIGFAASIFQLLGIASVGSLLLPDEYKPGPTYLLWVFIGLALLLGIASSLFMVDRAVRQILARMSRPYELVGESYELIVRSAEIVQVTRLTIRFFQSGHYTYPHRYFWTGGTKPRISVRRPADALYLEVGQSQHWTIGQFVFARIVRRSEIVMLEFDHVMPRTAFQPYVSRTTEDSAAALALKVRLEDGTALAAITQLINDHPANEGAARNVPATIVRRDEHEWRIESACPHTQYMLGWTTA